MAIRRYRPEEIVVRLPHVEVLIGLVAPAAFYAWITL
jgi:hypothetical protein